MNRVGISCSDAKKKGREEKKETEGNSESSGEWVCDRLPSLPPTAERERRRKGSAQSVSKLHKCKREKERKKEKKKKKAASPPALPKEMKEGKRSR